MAKKDVKETVTTSNKEVKKTQKQEVKLDEKLDIVEENIEEKIESTPISLDEAKEVIDNIDISVNNNKEEEEIVKKINEFSKIIEQVNETINLDENKKLEEIMFSENPEEIIKKEIEKSEKAQEQIEKIIKRPRTSSWNGINYGF